MIGNSEKGNRIDRYQESYLSQYDFESQMVRYRRRLLLERLHGIKPRSVVEVGCGAELLYQYYLQTEGSVDRWLIIEPSGKFYDIANRSGLHNLVAIQGFFEESLSQIRAHLSAPPEMIIISGVLHEVPEPSELLLAANQLMNERSLLHVNVPNAGSLHRKLAQSMGLITDTKSLSDRNRNLMQYRVYNGDSLQADVEAGGFSTVATGGYLVKPFTHGQMHSISRFLGEAVLDGLYQLGKDHPDLASEIFLEARKV